MEEDFIVLTGYHSNKKFILNIVILQVLNKVITFFKKSYKKIQLLLYFFKLQTIYI